MQLLSLSNQPDRPSLLLKWPSITVLLDCAVDMRSLASFLPSLLVDSTRLSSLPGFRSTNDQLKMCNDQVFVDAIPELSATQLSNVAVDTIDAVLVSNWMSMIALPFITERVGFRGTVYATDPTVQLGRVVMEELIEYFERMNKDRADDKWRNENVWMSFSNRPNGGDPRQWRKMYSSDEMNSSLSKVKLIAHRETVSLLGLLSISAYCSGYSIGSCNWMIRTDFEKIAYLSATSSRTSHTKAVDWDQLKNVDALVLTSICRYPEHNPEESVHRISATVIDTLKRNGNVLIPLSPIGVLYDLLECLVASLNASSVSLDVPIYFLSPVAEKALAFSNIYAEWLSDKKQNMIYLPEEPFPHTQMLNCGRLKVYNTMYENFSREFRTPCVIFTGHPSLRFGDAVHFIELWCNDPKNTLILTDPDYPLSDVLGPYQTMAMRSYFYPIDTRLDYSQINTTIMPELNVKQLLLPEEYIRPPTIAPTRTDFTIQHPSLKTFCFGETITLSSLNRPRKRVRMDPDLLKTMEVSGRNQSSRVGYCSVYGLLSAYDNVLEIKSKATTEKENDNASKLSSSNLRPCFVGHLEPKRLIDALVKKGIRAEVGSTKPTSNTTTDHTIISIPDWSAVVSISANGLRSKISCQSKSNRSRLADVIASCLTQL